MLLLDIFRPALLDEIALSYPVALPLVGCAWRPPRNHRSPKQWGRSHLARPEVMYTWPSIRTCAHLLHGRRAVSLWTIHRSPSHVNNMHAVSSAVISACMRACTRTFWTRPTFCGLPECAVAVCRASNTGHLQPYLATTTHCTMTATLQPGPDFRYGFTHFLFQHVMNMDVCTCVFITVYTF